MPLPVIADTFRVAMHWADTSGQSAVNVWHFLAAASTALDVKNDLDATVTAAMWMAVPDTAAIAELHITPLDGSSATSIFAVSGAKWAGPVTAGVKNFYPSSASLISQRTGLRGPAKRGRLYLPFPCEGQITNGLVDSAHQSGVQTAWNTFLAAITATGTLPVVASYKHSSVAVITNFIAERPLATQRRRQDKLR